MVFLMLSLNIFHTVVNYSPGHNILELCIKCFCTGSNPPQVKRNLTSGITNLVYGLPHEVPNEIRKYLKNLKFGWRLSLVLSPPSNNQT